MRRRASDAASVIEAFGDNLKRFDTFSFCCENILKHFETS
jgi:hypothetical protein